MPPTAQERAIKMSKVKPGFNDILTVNPFLAKEWDLELNKNIVPSEIAAHSNKKYWWKCSKNHTWLATPNNRTNGFGCPYCSGRRAIPGRTDLASCYPLLLTEWDYDKNIDIDPSTISAKSNKLYWWKCKEGHSWEDRPCHRIRGDGCPYCSGHRVLKGFNDLATLNRKLATEWNYSKNGSLTPDQITVSSSKKVWWKCLNGHEWMSTVAHRNLEGLGCPYCSGRYAITGETDLATINPLLAAEWHPTKNLDFLPSMITANSEKKVWWKCPICHFEWLAKPASRNFRNTGCPKCNKRNRTSFPEQAIYFYVKQCYEDAVNSYTEIFDNGMELDIFIPSLKIGIEYDGPMHKGKKADAVKYQICKKNNIQLIRISEIERPDHSEYCDTFISSQYQCPSDGGLDATLRELSNIVSLKNISIDSVRDKMKIYSQYLNHLRKNSLAEMYPGIAAEWHPNNNGDLLPEMFSWGSSEKVWWKCEKEHEWQATIASRTSGGNGCPICGKKKVKAGQLKTKLQGGKNSLFTVHPKLINEWNFEKNFDIDISQITPHSNLKVWWRCEKGHEWQAVVTSRSNGTGCPYCSGRRPIEGVTDLLTLQPDIAKAWDYEKNRGLAPNQFSQFSNKKVWWKCEKGHEWQATIASLTSGRWCPYCSGKKVLSGFNDLESLRPDLILEWNYDKNQDFLPSQVTEHSGKKAWWRCSKGHEWFSVIDSRAKGHGCPKCSRKKVHKKLNF